MRYFSKCRIKKCKYRAYKLDLCYYHYLLELVKAENIKKMELKRLELREKQD